MELPVFLFLIIQSEFTEFSYPSVEHSKQINALNFKATPFKYYKIDLKLLDFTVTSINFS